MQLNIKWRYTHACVLLIQQSTRSEVGRVLLSICIRSAFRHVRMTWHPFGVLDSLSSYILESSSASKWNPFFDFISWSFFSLIFVWNDKNTFALCCCCVGVWLFNSRHQLRSEITEVNCAFSLQRSAYFLGVQWIKTVTCKLYLPIQRVDSGVPKIWHLLYLLFTELAMVGHVRMSFFSSVIKSPPITKIKNRTNTFKTWFNRCEMSFS